MTSFPQLETDRLRLRSIERSDAVKLFDYFSKREVTEYYGMDSFKTLEEAETLIHSFQIGYQSNKLIRWGIELKETNELIGTCGFHALSKKYKRAEVGYEISHLHWQKGYASEAIEAILDFGFEEMEMIRIGAVVMLANSPSRSVLLRLGFKEEGRLRNYIIQDNIPCDVIMHSLLKEEWIKSSCR
ncbi:GNAT family N-acetyltransferase [Peribacillus frigoritolerans]|uniref:GNAT family N-acetyltransferase n=1 Tax=Peribacillus frigoritolerans TaxID=450367 RepID=UPI001059A037|nr:GNAT family protein [Peribacillus frigoritolerans]TDL79161.1 N-acetyltransferase [Peribacillus frigoritolerans]